MVKMLARGVIVAKKTLVEARGLGWGGEDQMGVCRGKLTLRISLGC